MIKLSKDDAIWRLEQIRAAYNEWFNRKPTDREIKEFLEENIASMRKKFIESVLASNDYQQTLDLLEVIKTPDESEERPAGVTSPEARRGSRPGKPNSRSLGDEPSTGHSSASNLA